VTAECTLLLIYPRTVTNTHQGTATIQNDETERRGSVTSQHRAKSAEPSTADAPTDEQTNANGPNGTMANNPMMMNNGMAGPMGFGFPNQPGFNNGMGFGMNNMNGMSNMMGNGNWNGMNSMGMSLRLHTLHYSSLMCPQTSTT
jgi:hypothetical protein